MAAKPDALWVTFEGANAPKEPQPYDAVLMSVGRSPNGGKIGADGEILQDAADQFNGWITNPVYALLK